jgi:hypothetical protein
VISKFGCGQGFFFLAVQPDGEAFVVHTELGIGRLGLGNDENGAE